MPTRILAVALCATALLVPAATAQAGWALHLRAPGHHPKAGEKWPIRVSAKKRSGKPLHAKALYRFLYHGQVVATRSPYPHSRRPYPFFGHFRDVIRWPKRSVGIPLKFRVVVKTRRYGKKHVDYRVRVRS